MKVDHARAVADAVLFEGYALYPYRRSSLKNQQRWPFGVLAPRAFDEAGGGEPSWMQTECLALASAPDARIEVTLRFLRARRRRVEAPAADGAMREVDAVDVDGRRAVAWDEGETEELTVSLALRAGEERAERVPFAGDAREELVRRATGEVAARVVRERRALEARIEARVGAVDGARGAVRVHVRVDNVSPWEGAASGPGARDAAFGAFFVGTHLVLVARGGELLSLLDPPDWAERAASACRNVRAFPVLAAPDRGNDVVLASPIILYDHPRIAPESPGEFFDATEIDELLALRTRTMTDDEKREARALDPRVAALIDRADALTDDGMERLHGAIRELDGAQRAGEAGGVDAPDTERDVAPGVALAPGARVVLRPGARRADAQDIFFAGMSATVRAVLRDAEDRAYVAVTIDDDPAAELHLAKNRFFYFYADEIELARA